MTRSPSPPRGTSQDCCCQRPSPHSKPVHGSQVSMRMAMGPRGTQDSAGRGPGSGFPRKMGRCLRKPHPPSLAQTLWLTVVPGLRVLLGSQRILCPPVTQTQGLP